MSFLRDMAKSDGNREDVIGIVERKLMPYLEASGWEEKYDLNDDDMTESRRALAEEYWEAGNAFLSICFGVVFTLILIDHFVYVESVIYGLMVNIAGAAAIFFSGVRDPAMISAVVDADIKDAQRELEARKMAYHNSGFGLLFVGFTLQLAMIVLLPDSQVIGWNVFQDGPPSLIRGSVLLASGLIFYRYCIPRGQVSMV